MRTAIGLILFCVAFSLRPAIAQSDIKKNSLPEIATTEKVNSKNDTVRALRNLFHRKLNSTRIKRGIVGTVVDVLLIRMWTHQHTLPQGGSAIGGPTVEGGSSVPVSSYVAVGVATAVVVEIVAQQRYGQRKLEMVLTDYENGKPIPKRIRSRIAPRDFEINEGTDKY